MPDSAAKTKRRSKPSRNPSRRLRPSPKAETQFRTITSLLIEWFLKNARDLPWRRTLDPYAVWISEIMLQQTQVKTVIPYFNRWMAELPNSSALANVPQQRVLKLWEGLGYYTRARNLQKAAQQIAEKHDGIFPTDFDAILALSGIGRYTAGAIASIAFNQPRPILDGNVIRVLCRLFAIRENPREPAANKRLWQLAGQLVNAAGAQPLPHLPSAIRHLRFAGSCSVLNQSLMELGATVCTPRSPACPLCPLRSHCVAARLKLTDELPNLSPRAASTERQFHTFIVRSRQHYLVVQRPDDAVNGSLWEFPNCELNGHPILPADSARKLMAEWGEHVGDVTPFTTLKHTITRFRITQHVFIIGLSRRTDPTGPQYRWHTVEELLQLPFTSAHKKLLGKLAELP